MTTPGTSSIQPARYQELPAWTPTNRSLAVDEDFDGALRDLLAAAEQHPAGLARQWLQFRQMRVYLRVGPRWFDGARWNCVQIANLDTPEAYQKQGLFTALVRHIQLRTALTLMVENAHPAFAQALLGHGWRVVASDLMNRTLVKSD